uniref:Uncharacterized protein n=1 Tax=Cereibacter sphaeroides (strain ATCC 17025 / ATH 2.4.3) TaxID=349102 RepID=A4WRL5_CERS5
MPRLDRRRTGTASRLPVHPVRSGEPHRRGRGAGARGDAAFGARLDRFPGADPALTAVPHNGVTTGPRP